MTVSRRKQNFFIIPPQQQQQHVTMHSDAVMITVVNNTSSSTHEQKVTSSSINPETTTRAAVTTMLIKSTTTTTTTTTTSSLFVNHSANNDDEIFKQKEGCSSNSSRRCRLEFVHIPKTGGTAVELAGVVANISWGACRFFPTVWVDSRHKIPCPNITTTSTSTSHSTLMRIGPLRLRHRLLPPDAKRVNDWHLPPHYFNVKKFAKNGMNPYRHDANDVDHDDVAIFAIVRDPYERAISEYYYANKKTNDDDDKDPNNNNNNKSSKIHMAPVMNRWLEMHLAPLMLENYTSIVIGETQPRIAPATRSGGETNKSMPPPRRAAVYYQKDGHFIPQYDYIFDDDGGPQQAAAAAAAARRVVHHVLHFEHLQADFAKLMAAYNLSVVLPDPDESQQQQQKDNNNNAVVARKTRVKKLNKYNLTLDNIRRIETIYARDFATFGYPTISSEMEKKK